MKLAVSISEGRAQRREREAVRGLGASKEAQELAWKKGKSYQILTNTTAETSPNSPSLDDLKLISYDMDKYAPDVA